MKTIGITALAAAVLAVGGVSGASGAAEHRPGAHVLTNPAGDITVVTYHDDETFVQFFQRNRVMVGGVSNLDEAVQLIGSDRLVVHYPMFNTKTLKGSTASVKVVRVAPVQVDLADRILAAAKANRTGVFKVIFARDETDPATWHVVGFSHRALSFRDTKRTAPDDFAPADLTFDWEGSGE